MTKNWDRTNTGRLCRIEPPLQNMDDQSNNGENNRKEQEAPIEQTQNAPQRTITQAPRRLQEHRNPPMESAPSCIVPLEETYGFRSQVLGQLPTYHGYRQLGYESPIFFHLAISSWNLPHNEHTRPLAYVYESTLTSKHTYSF